jgi:hypothetical protein
MIGSTSIDRQPDATTINALLLQDLGFSGLMAGPLPEGWLESDAAGKSLDRVEKLIEGFSLSRAPCFIADSLLCRVLPLWLQALEKAGVHCTYIFLIRHPWEVAQSLASAKKIETADAFVLWLSYVRDALRSLDGLDYRVITFDELLADPISTLSGVPCVSSAVLKSAYRSVLDFVQPGLRKFRAGNFSKKDKMQYQAYKALYEEILSEKFSNIYEREAFEKKSNFAQGKHRQVQIVKEGQKKGILKDVQKRRDFAKPDLIDSLLSSIGKYQQGGFSLLSENKEERTHQRQGLFVRCIFPTSKGCGEFVETIPLIEDEWKRISLSSAESWVLQHSPIVIKPLGSIGAVKISAIRLINKGNGESLFSAGLEKGFEEVIISGDAVRFAHKTLLTVLVTGKEPRLELPIVRGASDGPVQFELWIKAMTTQRIVQEKRHLFCVTELQETGPSFHSCVTLPNNWVIPMDKEAIQEYLLDNRGKIGKQEEFWINFELARYYLWKKNIVKAMHFFSQARKAADEKPSYLFKLLQGYLAVNRFDIALELYIDGSLREVLVDRILGDKLVRQFNIMTKAWRDAREHGQKILMNYIKDNLEYCKSQSGHKLTLIEIGSTREEMPGQGSTKKLAEFCHKEGLHFITVDMDPGNTKLAMNDLVRINESFEAVNQKGEEFLDEYSGPIDFVFLDAYDYNHGKHSEEREGRYEKYLGARISDEACHLMHLECARAVRRKIPLYGAICFDDTWFSEGKWRGKGALAVGYLLDKNFCVTVTGNRSALLSANCREKRL